MTRDGGDQRGQNGAWAGLWGGLDKGRWGRGGVQGGGESFGGCCEGTVTTAHASFRQANGEMRLPCGQPCQPGGGVFPRWSIQLVMGNHKWLGAEE